MALLTGWSRFDSVMGVPLLIESGTARLDGMCAAIGARSTRRTSSGLSPTLESARLSTMYLFALGNDSRSSVSWVTRRFFSEGTSGVAIRTSLADRSIAASMCSLR